jgi:hypothetical protein
LQARRTSSGKSIAPNLANLPAELALHACSGTLRGSRSTINHQLTLQRSQA